MAMRWYVRAGVSLLGGVLCTVATAWMCVFLPRPQWQPRLSEFNFSSADEAPAWDVRLERAAWFTLVQQMEAPTGSDPSLRAWPWPAEERMASLRQEVPAWARAMVFRAPTADDLSTGRWTVQVGVGWPFRSTYGRFTGLRQSLGEAVQGLDLRSVFRGPMDSSGHRTRYDPYRPSSLVFPLRPIWPGFLSNAGLFALTIFTAWSGIVGLRLWCGARRIRRGLCPSCRYPLTSTGKCSECGATNMTIPAQSR